MRKTHALVQVAVALLDPETDRHWGYDLSKRSGVRPGVLYPILHRLLDEGWLTDGWEQVAPNRRRRPPRRYYELTDRGRHELGGIVADAQLDPRFAAMFAGLFG